MQAHLSRHILGRHKNEQEVIEILLLPRDQRLRALSMLKKKGIYDHNKQLLLEDGADQPQRERRKKVCIDRSESSSLKVCGSCKVMFDRRYIWRHKKVCGSEVSKPDIALQCLKPMSNSQIATDGKFYETVISKLRDDNCGLLVRSDRLIQHVGLHYYRTSPKKDRKLVMAHMRRLGNLLIQFRIIKENNMLTAADMLDRRNFAALTEALEVVSDSGNDTGKCNLKLSLGYLLKKCVHVMQGLYLIDGKDGESEQVGIFLKVLEHHWGELFGEAVYKADKRRQEKLRKPRELPLESDLSILRKHCQTVVRQLTSCQYRMFNCKDFGRLRAALVTMLTIFNAHRGSEPARMEVSDWHSGEKGEWIDPQTVHHITKEEEQLMKRLKLVYQAGKGTKDMVPVLIPEDCVSGIRRLLEERDNCGVSPRNQYVFPYCQNSSEHVIGWHEIRRMSMEAQVVQPRLITANRVRHRAATVHASLDVPNSDRDAFFKHMGHSKEMDAKVYQCPLGVTEVCRVGKYLEDLDNGNLQLQKG